MEMCEAATRGPWKVFKGVVETLIGTAYDHPQMKGPDSIVGRAISARGDYVYIRENDATLLAEARTALPYWLQEAKRLKVAIECAIEEYGLWNDKSRAAEVIITELKRELSTLYPDTPRGFTADEAEAHGQVIKSRSRSTGINVYPNTPAPTPTEDPK
jgi:hypothetical protein